MAECIHNDNNKQTLDAFRVEYFSSGECDVTTSPVGDLYFYKAYIGDHDINIELGDCAFYVNDEMTEAFIRKGPARIHSTRLATIIRGYMPEDKSSTITGWTNLPYVNGCSTKQIFPPERIGDPTLQLLDIPPHSAEQAHHIHSTARVVLVLRGNGYSVVGMGKSVIRERLYPGKVVVLHKMSPHHFETDCDRLIVLPLHVFSSTGAMEKNHPMFNGTHTT